MILMVIKIIKPPFKDVKILLKNLNLNSITSLINGLNSNFKRKINGILTLITKMIMQFILNTIGE